MTSIRLVFIGGGINSAVGVTHKIASQMDDLFHLEAGCFSRNAEVNKKTGEAWGVAPDRVYPDWPTLLRCEKSKIDTIAVLTPTPFHTNIVIESLREGYKVICEKALTTSVKTASKIVNEVEKNDGFLAVTYNYTGYPMLRELRQQVKDGNLGKIHQIHIEMPQEGYIRKTKGDTIPKIQKWRLTDGEVPMISLDLGAHLHHMIKFLTDEKPLEVVSIQDSLGHNADVVDNVICHARYTNDLICNIWFSKSALGYRNGLRVRVFGANGSAEWYQMNPEELILNNCYGERSVIDRGSCVVSIADAPRYNRFKAGHPSGFIEAFANIYFDIAELLREPSGLASSKSEYVFSARDALEGLAMLEAIDKSSKNKRWETVEINYE